MPEPKAFLSNASSVVTLTATALGSVAALGFPAVAVQHQRLGIPFHLITTERAFRAGILPGLVLVGILTGVYWLVRNWAYVKVTFLQPPSEEVVGFLAATLTLLFQMILILELSTLGIGYLLLRVIRAYNIAPDNGAFLILFLGAFLTPFVLSVLVRLHVISLRLQSSPVTDRLVLAVVALYAGFELFVLAFGFWWELNAYWSNFPAMHWLAPVSYFDIAAFSLPAAFVGTAIILFGESVRRLPRLEQGQRGDGLLLGILAVGFAYAGVLITYAGLLYPGLPYTLGGGRPDPVNVWFEKKDLPIEVESVCTMTTADADLVGCSTYLLHLDDNSVILTAQQKLYSPSLVLPRASVKALRSNAP